MLLIIQVIIPDDAIPIASQDAESQGLTLETYIRNALLTAWHAAKKCPKCSREINHEMFKHLWEAKGENSI